MYSWLPDWPENVPFYFWQTSSGSHYRLNSTMVGKPEAEGLPMAVCDPCETPETWYDRFGICEKIA